MRFIDLTGKKFGRLLVLSLNKKCKHTTWNCLCDCGNKKVVCGCHLVSGKIVSCGCASRERIGNLNKTHGKSKTRLYKIWTGIKTRCLNKNSSRYLSYGGRGIKICNEWLNNYLEFENWALNNGYQEGLTIDRIDNNGNYEPSNCRWATNKQQSNNTRRTIFIYYNGKRYSMKSLCEQLDLNYNRFNFAYRILNYDLDKSINYSKKYNKGDK